MQIKLKGETREIARDKFAIDSAAIMLADTGAKSWMSWRSGEPSTTTRFL
jgi:hypothetical protein